MDLYDVVFPTILMPNEVEVCAPPPKKKTWEMLDERAVVVYNIRRDLQSAAFFRQLKMEINARYYDGAALRGQERLQSMDKKS
jgi:hypothetical protein